VNVNFVVVAKNAGAAEHLERRVLAAVDNLVEIYGPANDHVERRGNAWLYNADRTGGTWRVPTWFENAGVRYGVTQPPVPTDQTVTLDSYASVVHHKVWREGDLRELLMNHSGYAVDGTGRVRVWTDFVGMARCYSVESEDWIAFGNHIGSLAFFRDSLLQLHRESLELFANFGWFMDDLSPFQGITRVGRATIIDVDESGHPSRHCYEPLTDLVGTRGVRADFRPVVESSRTAAANLDLLSVRTPTVYLSGGRDSRMSASLWLSGGGNANVVTLGNLPGEVEIAEELIRIFRSLPGMDQQEVSHRIAVNKPAELTMTLGQRLRVAHAMWDGDAAPTNIRRNVVPPSSTIALSIGGSNGEVARSFLYAAKELEAVEYGDQEPLRRLLNSYTPRHVTPEAGKTVNAFLERQQQALFVPGVSGLVGMDVFYLTQKLRRWSNQQILSTSALLLGSHAFVRSSYDLTAEERVSGAAPVRVTRMAIPEWTAPPYYKATAQEAQVVTRNGLRIWLTDREEFQEYMQNPTVWAEYLSTRSMKRYLDLVHTGEATRAHESWFQRAVWLDSLETHRQRLNARLAGVGIR